MPDVIKAVTEMNKEQIKDKFHNLPPKRQKVLLGLLNGDDKEKIKADLDGEEPRYV
jgi:Mg/Co/Ni transporter MgtE